MDMAPPSPSRGRGMARPIACEELLSGPPREGKARRRLVGSLRGRFCGGASDLSFCQVVRGCVGLHLTAVEGRPQASARRSRGADPRTAAGMPQPAVKHILGGLKG